LLAAALLAGTADAAFKSTTASISHSVSTGTLAAPTGLTATCVTGTSNVTLSWTATTSTIATGYAILRATTNGGPYSRIATVSGRTTTTYTDTIAILATQYYVVEATRNNWTSPNSNQAGVHSIALGVCTSA
jgi:cellulose 1,4-beta-cellobiosidase